ncbi:alpha-(1,3)-fucosyltransferase C-like isoform X2 [Mizuhopecten yessoensis]|uniref:Fucosyltransferase n=1 Tax=Mizuhopecten yessoensis TaxID=6573 RepID=A0A210QK64_MIZYE|nr:alpha-(1,3)-fucosyltransferase C-like isoform X2 [Mizuhopecten yessoensis]OWF49147.1 Alpha-(1,3)-fucosyltransferase C [Mizuhopecten yessoensis]
MARRFKHTNTRVLTSNGGYRCCTVPNFRLYFVSFILIIFMGPVLYAVPYLSMSFRKKEMTSPEVFIDVRPSYDWKNKSTYDNTVNWKSIHYYNPPGWLKTDLFNSCDHPCYLTTGKHISQLDKDTAIIFHAPDIMTFPQEKPLGQIWIFHSMESPKNHHNVWASWEYLFNWTLGYRRDADIFSPYSMFVTKKRNSSLFDMKRKQQTTAYDITSKAWKAKLNDAVWFVSKCKTSSMRQQYGLRLGRYIDIDTFGECGKFLCWRRLKSLCEKFMKKWYKFYLSFENSLCKDYITEKSFNLYSHNTDLIPVTRSGANVSLYLPTGSYVTTSNFVSIQSLGSHLNTISSDYDLFSNYFKWKRFYTSKDMIDSEDAFCELCRRLHVADHSTKYHRLYGSIHAWLVGSVNSPMCTDTVTDIFNITSHA